MNRKTIYQGLNMLFANNNGIPTNINPLDTPEKAKLIIKGSSPEEVNGKALELLQRREIERKFNRTNERSFEKSMQYEAARLPAYMDYEGMEYYPLIGSALDLFMEEATTIGVNGKMLNIYSDKARIKYLLEELFYNVLNINVNLPFWTRNTIKYGDNFVYILGYKNEGVVNVKQLVNYNIDRLESKGDDNRYKVYFKDKLSNDKYNNFEIAHFRMLGDDKFIPYGSSILNKVRRTVRMLIQGEDAMLTYRIIRAGEKRVFKIDVGNIDSDDIEAYVSKVMAIIKQNQNVNPDNGQFDYRFNVMTNDEDYVVPVRNMNSGSVIDTLPGATNLDAIADIEYLRDNLFIGLGIPKPFLSFQEAGGGGKSMAQFDVRFAKKVNRIQQTMLLELNKIAAIHLYYLGFSPEECGNFALTLNNSSTQEELLKSELLRDKAQTYVALTTSENGGIAPMSHTEAKKLVFNKSDNEIILDLKRQKMEHTIAQELQDAPLVIKKTGIFNDLDKRYGTGDEVLPTPSSVTGGTSNNIGGGSPGAGIPPSEESSENNNEFNSPAKLPPVEGEGLKKSSNKILTEDEYDSILNKLVTNNKSDDLKSTINETQEKLKHLNYNALSLIKEYEEKLNDEELKNLFKDLDI